MGALTQKTSSAQQQNQNFIFSKFIVAQKQIVYNSDTQAIFSDIMPLLKLLYLHYFDMEVHNAKSMIKKSDSQLTEQSFKGCLQFCKEFGFMPYMLSQRVTAFVWYTVINTGLDDPTMSKKGINQELCNNPDQTKVIPLA